MKKLLSLLAVGFALVGFVNLAQAEDAPIKKRLKTTSGAIIDVVITKDASGKEIATVVDVVATVTLPNGTTQEVTSTSGPLIGLVVRNVTSTSTSVVPMFVGTDGRVLSSAQAASAFTQSVSAGIATAGLPTGTTQPAINSISYGTVSNPPSSSPGQNQQDKYKDVKPSDETSGQSVNPDQVASGSKP